MRKEKIAQVVTSPINIGDRKKEVLSGINRKLKLTNKNKAIIADNLKIVVTTDGKCPIYG